MASLDIHAPARQFLELAQQVFGFLLKLGWVMTRAEVDPTGIRGEDAVQYVRGDLMIHLDRRSYDDCVMLIFGKHNTLSKVSRYPLGSAVGLYQLLEALNIESPKLNGDSREQLLVIKAILTTHCSALLRGDATLLEVIWTARATEERRLSQVQQSQALHREVLNGNVILEVPATLEVMGADFFVRYPPEHHLFGATVFIVESALGEMVVDTLEQARETALEWGNRS